MSIFAPKQTPRPETAPDRSMMDGVVKGMGVVRREIFSEPMTRDGWAHRMVTHINVAKGLGFTMFEVDTKPTRETVAAPPSNHELYSALYQGSIGEAWKTSSATKRVDTFVVTVYALAVE